MGKTRSDRARRVNNGRARSQHIQRTLRSRQAAIAPPAAFQSTRSFDSDWNRYRIAASSTFRRRLEPVPHRAWAPGKEVGKQRVVACSSARLATSSATARPNAPRISYATRASEWVKLLDNPSMDDAVGGRRAAHAAIRTRNIAENSCYIGRIAPGQRQRTRAPYLSLSSASQSVPELPLSWAPKAGPVATTHRPPAAAAKLINSPRTALAIAALKK
jgi:hypothetical protein